MAQNLLTLSAGGLVTEISTAYAPLASPTFTGTVGGITAAMVGAVNKAGDTGVGSLGMTALTVTTSNQCVTATGATVNARYFQIGNTTGRLYIGVDDSTGASFGSAAYESIWYTAGNSSRFSTPLATFTGSVSTGALTATTVKVTSAGGFKSSDDSAGITTTVTTASLVGKTLTIKDGIITGFA